MPAWLTVVKAILPHVSSIVSAAAPAFTRKNTDTAANQALLQKQIAELQSAASANDAHIKELAQQVQATVQALDEHASLTQRRHGQMLLICTVATLLSIASLVTALLLFLTR